MQFKLHQPTLNLLAGLKGLEIGGASHNPFGVDVQNVAPVADRTKHDAQQRKMGEEPLPVDIDAYAHDLPADDDSQDFVLSSHVLEHLPDPIRAMREWKRVVRDGGYIVMIVPQPDAHPDDRGKSLTTLEELKAAYKEKATVESDPGHLWVFDINSLKAIIEDLNKGRYGLKWELVGEEPRDTKVGNGFWLAYRVSKS